MPSTAPRVHRRAAEGYAIRRQVPGAPPRSLGVEPLSDLELAEVEAEEAESAKVGLRRPRMTADCPDERLPCPWHGCPMSLLAFKSTAGAWRVVHPDRDFMEMPAAETCALRVAAAAHARGGESEFEKTAALDYGEIGRLQSLTLERASRIAEGAIEKLRGTPGALAILSEFVSARGGSR